MLLSPHWRTVVDYTRVGFVWGVIVLMFTPFLLKWIRLDKSLLTHSSVVKKIVRAAIVVILLAPLLTGVVLLVLTCIGLIKNTQGLAALGPVLFVVSIGPIIKFLRNWSRLYRFTQALVLFEILTFCGATVVLAMLSFFG